MNKVKIVLKYIIIPLVSAIIIVEIFVRIKFERPGLKRVTLAGIYEPALFSRVLFPEKKITIRSRYGDKLDTYEINSHGFRNREFKIKKNKNMYRIIVYGGSAVFGLRLSTGEDWPAQLEIILNKAELKRKPKSSRKFQVINAGIPFLSSIDSVGRLLASGIKLKPNMVILSTAWNDIKLFRSKESLLRLLKPLQKQNDPRISYQGYLDELLSKNSTLYSQFRKVYYNKKLKISIEGSYTQGEVTSILNKGALKQYELNIATFISVARSINAKPIIISQPRLIERNNSKKEQKLIRYRLQKLHPAALYQAFHKVDQIMKRISTVKNSTFVNINSDINGELKYFQDHVHLTKVGAKLVAHKIAKQLSSKF